MLRVGLLTVLILVNFVLQATLFPHLAILGVTPDSAIILVISYAILRGDIEGGIFGFFVGLMQDLMGGRVIGFYALLGFIVGFACGKPFKDFFKDNYFLPFFVVIGVSFVYQMVIYVSTVMFLGGQDFFFYLRVIILPQTIYTASLAVPLYALMHFVNSKIEIWQEPVDEV
ncbi:MAG: rod shape-determining protein MreD [Defluviitaleaceae bacterium]|nr:rod shape-determining protein MreD [Defluviitaleaceae bacterium]